MDGYPKMAGNEERQASHGKWELALETTGPTECDVGRPLFSLTSVSPFA